MTLKEYGEKLAEDGQIEYIITAYVNGEPAGRVAGYTLDGVLDNAHSLDARVAAKVKSEYEYLPEATNE